MFYCEFWSKIRKTELFICELSFIFSDPYVKVEMYINGIREAKHKTKGRQNTQDPVWNQPCVFDINRENPKLLGHVFVDGCTGN